MHITYSPGHPLKPQVGIAYPSIYFYKLWFCLCDVELVIVSCPPLSWPIFRVVMLGVCHNNSKSAKWVGKVTVYTHDIYVHVNFIQVPQDNV